MSQLLTPCRGCCGLEQYKEHIKKTADRKSTVEIAKEQDVWEEEPSALGTFDGSAT